MAKNVKYKLSAKDDGVGDTDLSKNQEMISRDDVFY